MVYISREKTRLPAPQVWGWTTGEGTLAGVSYILKQHMPGKVLDWSSIDEKGKKKVIARLADLYIELQKHEFDKIGCLDQVGTAEIGPFVRECSTDFKGSSENWYSLVSYSLLRGYYQNSITLLPRLIQRGEIHTNKPVDAFLICKFLYDRVQNLYPINAIPRRFFGKEMLPQACR